MIVLLNQSILNQMTQRLIVSPDVVGRDVAMAPSAPEPSMVNMISNTSVSSAPQTVSSVSQSWVSKHKWKIGAVAAGVVGIGLLYKFISSNMSHKAKLHQRVKRFSDNKCYLTMRSQHADNPDEWAFVNALSIKFIDSKGNERDNWACFRNDGIIEVTPAAPIDKARESSSRLIIQLPSGDSQEIVFTNEKMKMVEKIEMLVGKEAEPADVSIVFQGDEPFFQVCPKNGGANSITQQLIYINSYGTPRFAKLVDPHVVQQFTSQRQDAVNKVLYSNQHQKNQPSQQNEQQQQQTGPTFDEQDDPHWRLPNIQLTGEQSPHPDDVDIDMDPM